MEKQSNSIPDNYMRNGGANTDNFQSANESFTGGVFMKGWEVRPAENRLKRAREEIRLDPKAMDLLLRLIAADGAVLPRGELINQLWPNVYASDDSLNQIVSRLRRALSVDKALKTAIITVPKRGYRLDRKIIGVGGRKTEENSKSRAAANPISSRIFHSSVILTGLTAAAALLLAGAFVFQSSRPAQNVDYSSLQARPLTQIVGRASGARFSPDGQTIAFAWGMESAQTSDIYIQRLSEFTPVKITSHPYAELNPTWSPRGDQLAFVRANAAGACNIVTVNLDSLLENTVHECNAEYEVDLSWGKDPQTLYFTDRAGSTGPLAIFRLSLATRQTRQISFPESNYLGDFLVRFSPYGEELAFVRKKNHIDADIFVMSAEGKDVRPVTEGRRKISGLSWGKTNEHLFFTTNRASALGLWRISRSAGRIDPIPSVVGDIDAVTVSANGARLVYEKKRIDSRIRKISIIDPGLDVALAPRRVSSFDRSPELSQDGKKLAYLCDLSGVSKLWISDADQSDGGPVAFDSDLFISASWSPSGDKLLFGAFVDRNFDVFLADADGRNVRRLMEHPASDYNPTWSPDGRYAYVTSNRTGSFQIWRVDVETAAAEQITIHGGHRAIEGKDGRLFVAKKHEDGLFELNLNDKNRRERLVTDKLSVLDWRNWSIVGENLYYLERNDQEKSTLRRINLNSGADTALRVLNNVPLDSGLSVTPDETSAYITTVGNAQTDLMLLQGLSDEI